MYLGALDLDSLPLLAAPICWLDHKLHKVAGLELRHILSLQPKQDRASDYTALFSRSDLECLGLSIFEQI